MSILGTRVLRSEDPRFLTVGGTYTEDLVDERLAGALHATFVRSPLAHARVGAVDATAARALAGVVAVLTAADLTELTPPKPMISTYNKAMIRPWLAADVVRFVGEPVAVVLSADRASGEDAAELVTVDYEALPAVVDPRAAVTDATLLFPAAGTNTVITFDDGDPDPAFFDGCEVVVTQEIVNQRVAPAPLEVRAVAAAWGADGRLTLWCPSQGAQSVQAQVVSELGVEKEQVHVLTPDVGGAFGAKFGADTEQVLVAWLARRFDRPVRWVETRSENLVGMTHGRAQQQTVTIGGSRDGAVLAYRLEILQDSGAYPRFGPWLPSLTRLMAPGVYAIEKVESRAVSVLTNTTPIGAYRGAGRPEATAAIERAMDVFAAEIGMDPAELRRRNLLPAFTEPHTTPAGATYDTGDYPAALQTLLDAVDYAGLRREQAQRRESGDVLQLGIGLAVYVEITGGGEESGEGTENATVEVHQDGSATVLTGTSPHGQGHGTAWAMLASEELGIPIERITVIHGDTDLIPEGGGTGGSRSLQQGGAAVAQAAKELVEVAKGRAADELEANPDDIVLDKDRQVLHVVGSPDAAVGLGALAENEPLLVKSVFTASAATFPFGAHLALAEVDTESGKATLRRIVAVDDAGTLLNPLLAEGQRHGGIAQGAAQALLEEVAYDEDGNPQTTTLADYPFLLATEVPTFELLTMATPTPINPLGAKGIGESGTIGSTPAVQNAVVDAVAHLGVRHIDMPTSPERVWKAIREASE